MRDAETNDQEATLAKPGVHLEWEADYRTSENERFYNQCFDEILRQVGAPAGSKFLDAGCGIGAHSVRLAQHGYTVEAVDFSESILESAHRNVEEHHLADRISIKQANLRELPYADGEFAFVLCWGVLMHVPDVDAAIGELARVVALGGKLVVSEDNLNSVQPVVHRSLMKLLGRTRATTRTPAGLEKWRDTDAGALMTREADIPWLIQAFERRGLRLLVRRSGQFTEAYARVSWHPLQRAIHAFNTWWFRRSGPPALAFANILIFERPA